MKLVRGAWKLLVAIKDGLVLVAMLLFFGLLYGALTSRATAATIRDGALVLRLNGRIVEQPAEASTFASLSGNSTPQEFRLRDVVRALDAARTDDRVKAVVLDLDSFGGAYPAALAEVGDAIARVRAAHKPVLAYATAYTDGAYRLAANASEIWTSPMGGTIFAGPGGSQLYYKGLIDRLGVNVHVYRVGRYKSYVEPYIRADASPEAREETAALYRVLFAQWQEGVHRARPQADFADFLVHPDQTIVAAQGNIAQANLQAHLVDRLGTRIAFERRVGDIAGRDDDGRYDNYNRISYADYVQANPLPDGGAAIGVLTIAGDIVDGRSSGGNVGADTVTRALLDGLRRHELKALVVRVDSPGGSALASEDMRQAIAAARAQHLPIVVSMGSLAASGGYWVSTAGDVIFAQPQTITGSIGIFGIVPSFENTLRRIGITTDGVRTTPLSGQPDVMGGFTPETDRIFQAGIENGYREFLTRVAQSRHLTLQRVDQIGQGRVWDGGTARQLGLVDRFGGLDAAVAEAARRAGVSGGYHAEYLEKKPGWFGQLIARAAQHDDDDDDSTTGADAFSRVAIDQRRVFAQALGDVRRLGTGSAIQASCLECRGLGGVTASPDDERLLDRVLAFVGLAGA